MPRLPLYKLEPAPKLENGGHLGLWYERFFNGFDSDEDKQGNNRTAPEAKRKWNAPGAEQKKGWINTAVQRMGEQKGQNSVLAARLERATGRLAALALSQGGDMGCFRTDWRFVTGLGLPHPLENGFAWHPTLGVPYLPGAAVKGLVRAWLEVWSREAAEKSGSELRSMLDQWFGTESTAAQQHAGALIFFDALPTEPPSLAADVMTPHMGDWYARGGDWTDTDTAFSARTLPADWHDPVPIPFLTVAPGVTFQFAIAPRRGGDRDLVREAFAALEEALAWLGAGAKTAVGYGRMSRDEKAEKAREEKRREAEEAARKAEEKAREEEQMMALPPWERKREQLLKDELDRKKPPDAVLVHALERGEWPDAEDQRRVAEWILNWLEEKGILSKTGKLSNKQQGRIRKVQAVLGIDS